jgi:hypothetical protein
MNRRRFLRNSFGAVAGAAMVSRAAAAPRLPLASTRRILYVMANLTETRPAKQRDWIDPLAGSGFNVLVLSFLQASMAGGQLQLLYNDNRIPSLAPQVPALLAQLRSASGGNKRVQISIGGWGHTPTFQAIRSAGVSAFVRQLTDQVIVPLGLDGIDIDLEPQKGDLVNWIDVHRDYGTTIVDLTNEYKRLHPTHLVTHAPISPVAAEMYIQPAQVPGLQGNFLQATRAPRRHGFTNNIDWLNVQFYEGGVVTDGTIAGYYCSRLAAPLAAMRAQVGIEQPLHFLVPTFEPAAKQPLEFCRQTIAAINAECAGLHAGRVRGTALWDYHQIRQDIDTWSTGLRTALQA